MLQRLTTNHPSYLYTNTDNYEQISRPEQPKISAHEPTEVTLVENELYAPGLQVAPLTQPTLAHPGLSNALDETELIDNELYVSN